MIDSEPISKIAVEHIIRHAGSVGCVYTLSWFLARYSDTYTYNYTDVFIWRGRARYLYVRNCSESRQVIFLYTGLERGNISLS